MANVPRVINDIVSPCSLFEEEGRALGALLLISDCGITYESVVHKEYFIAKTRGKVVM